MSLGVRVEGNCYHQRGDRQGLRNSLTLGAGQAWEAGPGAQAGVFGMDPSWWVACQVEGEQLCQMGNQLEVPPASQPWASCFLVTCQVAGKSGTMEVHRSVAEPCELRSPCPPSLSHMGRPAGDQEQRGTGACAQRVNHTCSAPATALAAVPTNEAARVPWVGGECHLQKEGPGNFFRTHQHLPSLNMLCPAP